ncbi:cytochrome P450 [Mollisia scopiformis]|uniref:Cytochrome P450 n=1 Tax=Mollisia scopiformis TaxID=149040 RepID=A0A194X0J2_MOLSC|nr:cytochrome P450 [Mollisia scopiformis]KUJ13716.1 cytochrome P450 [Mollisia scopiformis]
MIDAISTSGPGLTLRLAVGTIFLLYATYIYIQRRKDYDADRLFGEKHGCMPLKRRLPYKWPLALDAFKRQYDALVAGNLLAFQSEYFEETQVGQTFEVKLLGRVGYFTLDPQNLEAILSTNFEDWGLGSRREGLYPMIGEGIFTQDGHQWKHSRELLRRQFVRIQYQDVKVFETPINSLLAALSSQTGVIDLQPEFFRFTLATTTSLIFGEPFAGLTPKDHEVFEENFDYCALIGAMRLRLANFCWLYNPSKFKQACAEVKKYATYYVNHALKDQEENGEEEAADRHPFILDLYKELRDPILVRDQLMNVLIAGRDTTACLMSWTFYLLVRHPTSLERLQQEIHSIATNGQNVTRAQIAKMPYLKCVLNETNRLYTQIPVNVREATKTTYIPRGGGPDGQSPVLIRKGFGIGFSPYHMHRSKDIYGEDANEFRPERWEGPQLKNIGFGFMPFHGGPRLCLGKDFALTEASYGIVRILQTFPNLRLGPDEPKVQSGQEKQTLTIVVASADGCKVLLS